MLLNILLIGFAVVIVIQLIYYILIFGKFSFSKNQNIESTSRIPISVIVCAKNEEENIRNFFPLLASQNYPEYEIVLIDDASSDDTRDIFEALEKEHQNVRVVKVDNNETFWGNKKYALTLGIKAAKYEYLLFTDADCYPSTKNWIKEMSQHFTAKKKIILGYGGYEKIKNSFLNKIIRFETLLTATQYFSWAKIGKPYMGVGRNLAYKREEFYRVRGFMDHMNIRSGDDDLFINQASTNENTAICITQDSFTYSKPKTSFAGWFKQKRRHVSTASHYKSFDRFQLGLYFISQFLFLVLATTLLVFQHEWILVASLIVFRYIFAWISLGFAASKLEEKDVMYWYPIIEIILIFTNINVFFTNLVSKPVHWK